MPKSRFWTQHISKIMISAFSSLHFTLHFGIFFTWIWPWRVPGRPLGTTLGAPLPPDLRKLPRNNFVDLICGGVLDTLFIVFFVFFFKWVFQRPSDHMFLICASFQPQFWKYFRYFLKMLETLKNEAPPTRKHDLGVSEGTGFQNVRHIFHGQF